jgi:oligosaccharyltransferase complex subunit alpha (ribophorin I)
VNEAAPHFKVVAVFTSLLTPYPKEITQAESQLVLLHDSHYFLSPYKTETQKTTFKLASSSIESYTKRAPNSQKGSSIIYGPYKEIAPFSFSAADIHYVNNKPFAKFSTFQREVEVSHWGNIAFEESYELKHAGAVLKGGFSRFDYQMKRQSSSPSFRSLVAVLPLQSNNIYYRDQIGNISTSDMKVAFFFLLFLHLKIFICWMYFKIITNILNLSYGTPILGQRWCA